MPAQWLSNSNEVSGRLGAVVSDALSTLARPAPARRLRQILVVLFALWALLALTRFLWALVPAAEPLAQATPTVINPVSVGNSRVAAEPVDINRMVGWHLFGEAGEVAPVISEPAAAENDSRDGIEDGAQETRLQLKLTGIVASTEDGLGHAIIENKALQAVYAVGDTLPVSGKVILAKVMPYQVVLDNGGTYELMVLFEESRLGAGTQASPAEQAAIPAPDQPSQEIDKRNDAATTSLAQSYRQRLYENPQSLTEVVNVSAVRENGALRGYRINPGTDQEQFEQLGFKTGDLVKSINGVSFDNPANTMQLYNGLRTAGEAVIELERDGQALTLSVNLDNGATE